MMVYVDVQVMPDISGEGLGSWDACFSVGDEIGVTVAKASIEGVMTREDIPQSI